MKPYSEIKEGDLCNATFVVVTQARDFDAIRIVDMCRRLGKFCAVGESRSSAGYFAIDLTDKVPCACISIYTVFLLFCFLIYMHKFFLSSPSSCYLLSRVMCVWSRSLLLSTAARASLRTTSSPLSNPSCNMASRSSA